MAETLPELVHFCFNSIRLCLECCYDEHDYNLPLYHNGLPKEMHFEIKNKEMIFCALWRAMGQATLQSTSSVH